MKDDVTQLSEVVVTGVGLAKDETVIRKFDWPNLLAEKAYDNYLESNLKYPEEALKNKIKGKARIEFKVVSRSLSDFRVIKKLGYGCEEEIIRLAKEGFQRGRPPQKITSHFESTVRVRLRFDPTKEGK